MYTLIGFIGGENIGSKVMTVASLSTALRYQSEFENYRIKRPNAYVSNYKEKCKEIFPLPMDKFAEFWDHDRIEIVEGKI
jgi:hypothetical protein